MDLGLQGRVAFIAGASGGLGLAVAVQLAKEGCRVAISSRSAENLKEARSRILLESSVEESRIATIVCDVTDEGQIDEAIQKTVNLFGGLNILITNAGGPPTGNIGDFSADQWRQGLELNLLSTINLCRHALPHLRMATSEESGLARILMITSISAKQPIPNLYLSNTARAGVQGFAKSLANELGPEGITVNTILPGYTRTQRLKDFVTEIQEHTDKSVEEIEAGWAEANALKRIADPEEFAAAVAFLVSARAGYITGIGLPVDGGRTKHLI